MTDRFLNASTQRLMRLHTLITALRDGPLARAELLARVGAVYPSGDSARRMIDRDCVALAGLGITITRSNTRPPIYTLEGGVPNYTPADLRTLALIRDSFGRRHPQSVQVERLLDRLTSRLTPDEQRIYARRATSQAPLQPAIDYTPYAEQIVLLEQAIALRQVLRIRYRNSRGGEIEHAAIEPYEIEYYERHFYLVAFSHRSAQIHDFRIDRIRQIIPLHTIPPGVERTRPTIRFRYRLAALLAQGEISRRFEAQRVVENLPDGRVTIEAEGRNAFFIVRTLLRYAGNAELLEPAWLRAQMITAVRELVEIYRDDMLESDS